MTKPNVKVDAQQAIIVLDSSSGEHHLDEFKFNPESGIKRMNNSDGFSSYSNVGSFDLIANKLDERYAEQAAELEELRDRNCELIAQLNEQQKRIGLDTQKREELTQKIVKITDENWAKDLEIAGLRQQEGLLQTELKNQLEQNSRTLREVKQAHIHELDALQETNSALNVQLKAFKGEMSAVNSRLIASSRSIEVLSNSISNKDNDIARIKHESEQALAGLRVRHDGEIQQLIKNEVKQSQLLETLQSSANQLKGQLNEVQVRSREELAKSFAEFELFKKHITEHTSRIQAEHVEQIEQASQLISAFELERDELRAGQARDTAAIQELSQRDGRLEAEVIELRKQIDTLNERAEADLRNMQNWQNQLTQREQLIAQTSDSISFEKSSLIRLAMKLSAELNMAKSTHPLKDYVGVIEAELASLQVKLKQLPNESLDRVKFVDGYKQVLKKREFLNSILAESQKQLEDRARGILAALAQDVERAAAGAPKDS